MTELNILTATFEQLHTDGAERFGLKWLLINQSIVSGACAAKLDPTTPELKRALSVIAYVICLDSVLDQLYLSEAAHE